MIDIDYAEDAVCPYCGHGEPGCDLEDEGIAQCSSCRKGYAYERVIEVSYNTWEAEEQDC